MKRFSGKVAIVTGGASGIGKAAALAFAREGAKVVVADNADASRTVDEIKAGGGEGIFVHVDVSKVVDAKILVEKTIDTYGRLDFAYNNAGTEGTPAPLHECSEENWERTIGINLRGVWACMKYELLHMRKAGSGCIVNCASVAGLVGFTTLPAYVASKHGVVGLTKTAALENARSGIRINAVCPGVIKTAMTDRFTGKNKMAEQQLAESEPVGRMGRPEEVAAAVTWLCSEEASFVTGQALAVDGGWVAQ